MAQVGIGAQQLDDVVPRLGWRGPLPGERVGMRVETADPVGEAPPRCPGERGRVLPALTEDRLDVVDRRALDRDLDVVPGRVLAVLLGERLRLRVATVVGVVAAVVGEVHATDERDVAGRVVAVADHRELLVVRAAGPDAHVEQHLCAASLQLLAEVAVLRGEESGLVQVGPPHQTPDVDAALVGATEHLDHLAAGLPRQPLVGVALPVGEEDEVALASGLDGVVELAEVRRAVDQRPDQVARGPGPVTVVPVVEHRGRVRPLRHGQQPLARIHAPEHARSVVKGAHPAG